MTVPDAIVAVTPEPDTVVTPVIRVSPPGYKGTVDAIEPVVVVVENATMMFGGKPCAPADTEYTHAVVVAAALGNTPIGITIPGTMVPAVIVPVLIKSKVMLEPELVTLAMVAPDMPLRPVKFWPVWYVSVVGLVTVTAAALLLKPAAPVPCWKAVRLYGP